MKKFDPTQLSYFTGTEKYYQLSDATPFGQTPPLRQNNYKPQLI
jgi:outer membrane phospholipase A